MAPTVTFVDSGELIVAAKSLGVAHPPGFPLYVMLAHLIAAIPIGNVAQRVNFASALFGALAVTLLLLLVIEAVRGEELTKTKPEKEPGTSKRKKAKDAGEPGKVHNLIILISALTSALVFAFSKTLWSFATVAEVYTLNTLLIVGICYLMFRWRVTQNTSFIYAAALLFGLGLGVHHVTVGVLLPALAVLVYRTAGWNFFKSRRFPLCALIAVAGTVIVYIYLPLSAQRSPVMNWGDPQTLQRFWWHISGHQYQVFFSFSPEQIVNQASQWATLTAREFGSAWFPLPLLLAAAGFIEMYSRHRASFWFFVFIVIADLAYSLNYEIAEDKGAYYLPAFMSIAAAIGFGAKLISSLAVRQWPQLDLKLIGPVVLAIVVLITTVAGNYSYSNRHNFYLASNYVSNIEKPIERGGMLLTTDWQVYSPLLYLREIEQQRRDIVAIDLNLLRRSWYFDYLRTQYPELMSNSRDAVETFLTDLRRWEQDPELFAGSPNLTRQINDHFHKMIESLIANHQREAPVYVTWEVGVGMVEDAELSQKLNQDYRLVPEGLVFRLGSDQNFTRAADPELETRGLNDGSFSFTADDVVMQKVLPAYISMMINRGKYLEVLGEPAQAAEAYRRALILDRRSVIAQQSLQRLEQNQSGK